MDNSAETSHSALDSNNDPSIPPANGTCLLRKLPLDLRDEICKLAYVQQDLFHVLSKFVHETRMDEDARRKKRKDLESGDRVSRGRTGGVDLDTDDRHEHQIPALVPHIERFLIDKQWHAEATEVFFANTHFYFTVASRLANNMSSKQMTRFITKITIETCMPPHLPRAVRLCSALNHLHFDCSSYLRHKACFRGDPTSQDWDAVAGARESSAFRKLASLRGLRSLTISLDRKHTDLSKERFARFAQNISVVQRTLLDIVTLPKGASLADPGLPYPPAEESNAVSAVYEQLAASTPSAQKLTDSDVPLDKDELVALMWERPEDLAVWVQGMRLRCCTGQLPGPRGRRRRGVQAPN